MELVNGNEESVGEVFAKYESSKDVYELINSLKALCDKVYYVVSTLTSYPILEQ